MNALPHAIANAPAHALPHASFARSASAKGREGKGQHRTGPNGVFGCSEFTIHLTFRNARAASSAKPQPGHVRIGWMDAPRFNGGQR